MSFPSPTKEEAVSPNSLVGMMVSAANFQAHEREQTMAQPHLIRHGGTSSTNTMGSPGRSVIASDREWLIAVIDTAINIIDEGGEEDIFALTHVARGNPQWPRDQ